MSLFSFLFPKPSIEAFAIDLIAGAAREGMPGWQYVPETQELHAPDGGGRVSLANVFLEYSNAKRAVRSDLMRKYIGLMVSVGREIPKLWSLAQKAIYPVLRCRRDMLIVQLRSRGETKPFPPRVEIPWQGDIVIRIAYDSGPTTSPIGYEELETWGVTVEQAYERALRNLRSLSKPRWVSVAPGVLQLDSQVSYEESLLLRDDVVASCEVRGDRVFMPINRGVLLATGTQEDGGIERLLEQARHSFQNNPWPLSPVMVMQSAAGLQPYVPRAAAASDLLHSLQALDTYVAHRDQQEALQEYCKKSELDVFVASLGLMPSKTNPEQLLTWTTWTDAVATWLPKADVIAFNKTVDEDQFETLIVPWDPAYEICRDYLEPLEEEPIRFSTEAFPDDDDWRRLCEIGEPVRQQ